MHMRPGDSTIPKVAIRITSRGVLQNPTDAQSLRYSLLPTVSIMKTDISPSVPDEGHTYSRLQQQIHTALRREHPEWVQPDGKCPTCEVYESRLAKLLGVPSQPEHRSAA
jgi:hypothetical protein